MQWSNSQILNKESQENQATVLEYRPKDFSLGTPEQALEYLQLKKQGSDFVLSDVLRKTTGIEEIEKQSEEQKIEKLVLDKVADIQKSAYDEGHTLGYDEGLKSAFQKKTSELDFGLTQLKQLIDQIGILKLELIHQNEAHIMRMIYEIAEKIAFDHIEQHPEVVLAVIKKSIETAQADQDVTVLVAAEQIEFIESMKKQTGREFEYLEKIKLQSSDTVQPGGCIIETNYGVIDARVQERTQKLWEEISQSLPKVKNSVG